MKTEDQCRFTNGGQHSFDPWCETHRRSAILCQRDARAEVERLKGALSHIEIQVSSNENKPTSVLCSIGRIARAALSPKPKEGSKP